MPVLEAGYHCSNAIYSLTFVKHLSDDNAFKSSLSDDGTDLSSPSSCGTCADNLDSCILDIPELITAPIDCHIQTTRNTTTTSHQVDQAENAPVREESFKQTLRRHSIPDQMKDVKYWKRRLRNNKSAKKSREAKRAKDDCLKNRLAFLEMENTRLRMIISQLTAGDPNVERIISPQPYYLSTTNTF